MSAQKSRAVLWLGVSFVVIFVAAVAPLISAFIAGAVANILGCTLNEGGASTCMFNGSDIGQTLADMFVLGWLAFVTLPWGGFALAIWLAVAGVVALVKWRRRRREA